MLPVQKDSFPETSGRIEQGHTNLLDAILPLIIHLAALLPTSYQPSQSGDLLYSE